MSDNWIAVIPRDPFFVPSDDAIENAEAWMAEIAPEAEEINCEVSEKPMFRDCGGNLMSIRCPSCKAEISHEWWATAMGDEDYWDQGFDLKPIRLPCGHVADSLNELRYDFDQGFSRFILDAMNPNVGRLSAAQVSRFEKILGCPVRIVYQHI